MSNKSNNNGRAYEYISLHILDKAISNSRSCTIKTDNSYMAAQKAWNTLDGNMQTLYTLSAQSFVKTLFALEPNIIEPTKDTLELYIQPDSHGKNGDVRDIIIKRSNIKWEVGLSLKHNHMAVKHSRLSPRLDFGKKWYGVECSKTYWNDIAPVFAYLKTEKSKGSLFSNLPNKEDDVYVPILRAFMQEVKQQVTNDNTIPRKLVEYLLSRYDFYKIISIDKLRLTTIQSFNMYGTLNTASRVTKPTINVPILALPTTLLHIDFKPNSKTTIIMTFDNGWQFSFRIHNAEDKVTSSLKFDVQIVGMPLDVNIKYNCAW